MRKNKYTEGNERQARGSKRAMLLSVVGACLSVTLLSSSALAEGCVSSPSCTAMGYTKSSCSDGGVKCPWGSYWFCGGGKSCKVKNCEIGDVLYSDKKCYTCPNVYTLPGQVPIGVVFTSGKAVALTDLSGTMTWSNVKSACSSYSVGGVGGWYLPSKGELLAMYNNRSSVVQGFSNAIGGKDFVSDYYWSSSRYDYYYYWLVNPVSGTSGHYDTNNFYVRPVLAF